MTIEKSSKFLLVFGIIFVLCSLISYTVIIHPISANKKAKKEYKLQKKEFEEKERAKFKSQRDSLISYYRAQWIATNDTSVHVIKSITKKKVVDREIGDWVDTGETECEIVSLTKRRCKPIKEWVHLYDTYKTVLDTEYTTRWKSARHRDEVIKYNVEKKADNVIEQIREKFHEYEAPNTWFELNSFKENYYGLFLVIDLILLMIVLNFGYIKLRYMIKNKMLNSRWYILSEIADEYFEEDLPSKEFFWIFNIVLCYFMLCLAFVLRAKLLM